MTKQHGNNVRKLGLAIIQKLERDIHATCLLILLRADILDLGEKEHNTHAVELGTWLRRVASGSVKILITSNEVLYWSTGEMVDFKRLTDSSVYNIGYEKNICEYFGKSK